MEEQDTKKASAPDGVSGWIIKECSHQLADKAYNIIVSSLTEDKSSIRFEKNWYCTCIQRKKQRRCFELLTSVINQCNSKNMWKDNKI